VTAALFELNAIASPDAGAAPDKVIVHVVLPDAVKVNGAHVIPLIVTGGGAELVTANTGNALPLLSEPSAEPSVTPLAVPGTVSVATTPSGIDPVLTPYATHE
jgi:hypothetical protein